MLDCVGTGSLGLPGKWQEIGLSMHGLAVSGWPECNRSVGVGDGICDGAPIGLPMTNLELSGWLGGTDVPSFTETTSLPSISGSNSLG